MTITIEIDCDNAAFDEDRDAPINQLRFVLTDLLDRQSLSMPTREAWTRFDGQRLRDSNGNTVGKVTVSE